MLTPYERLANAIVELAAKDYRRVHHKLKNTGEKHRDFQKLQKRKSGLLEFFRSGWYEVLTNVPCGVILKQIEREVD